MWRIFYDVENFIRCGDLFTIWRIFYDVEDFLRCGDFSAIWRLLYDVQNFLRCREFSAVWRIFYGVETFSANSFLWDSNSFHEYVSMMEALSFIRSATEPYSVQYIQAIVFVAICVFDLFKVSKDGI